MQDQVIYSEIFPIATSALLKLSALSAYKLEISSGDIATIGGKLAYRLRREFPGHWVFTCNRLVTDVYQSVDDIMRVVEKLWSEQSDVFGNLRSVTLDLSWHATTKAQADFVAKGLFFDIWGDIRGVLRGKVVDLGDVRVERVHEIRGWVVDGQPAVSISVSSQLIYKQDLKDFASKNDTPEQLIGLWVADKTSSFKGEIIQIEGKVKEHRKRLLSIAKRPEMQALIQNADDDEIVVRVSAGAGREYEYVASALKIVVRTEDFSRFQINSQQALQTLRMEPRRRSDIVKEIASLAKERGLVDNALNSKSHPKLFLSYEDVGFNPSLRFGDGVQCPYDEKSLLKQFRQRGLYKRAENIGSNEPIRIGVLKLLSSSQTVDFLQRIRQELDKLGMRSEFVCEKELPSLCRVDIENAVGELEEIRPHVILALFPDAFEDIDDESEPYHSFKSITVGRGLPSQVVYESTISNQYAIGNIVLGILSKTGMIPFVLGEPLSYADLVVGIDIARERKKHLPGSMNATAIARIYFSDGQFVRYVIHDAPLEGETIPEDVLQSLFPLSDFKGKRVVIHRDGYFRGGEKQALKSWAQKLGATFHLVEVIKTGAPRLYATDNGRPPKGTALRLSESEALLVSSLPPFSDATPQPLRIRTEEPFTIEQAIHSVLSLTLLHYGSLRPPKLPVTIHYSDRIAQLTLRGIKPKLLEGSVPYWL